MAIDPNSIAWDALAAPAIAWDNDPSRARAPAMRDSVVWDDDAQGPPRASFENVTSGVSRTAMTPQQASGEVPLPSDWHGDRPAASPARQLNFQDIVSRNDPFTQLYESAPVQDFIQNVRGSEIGRGAVERLNDANAFAAKIEAVPAIIWDKAASAVTGARTTAAQDWLFDRAAASERTADANRVDPNAGFLTKLAHGVGGLAVDLPMMVATGGESAVIPATRAAAPTVARALGGAAEQSAKASLIPGSVNATDTAQDVLERGGSGEEAARAAIGSAAADVVTNALPLAAEGGALKRIITGGGAGAVGARAATDIRNATLPDDMRHDASASDAAVGAVQGGALAALLGHAPAERPAAAGARADLTNRRKTAADIFARAGEDDGIQWDSSPADTPREPLALPAPVIDVTPDGVARTPAQRLQAEEAAAAEPARKAELGLTPDVERAIARRENAQEAPDLAEQRDNDAPPWWVAGQAEEAAVDAAAREAATSPHNDLPEPSDAQKEAGNYRKGHVRLNGLDVSIENPAGSRRRTEWEPLQNHYGYIRGTIGKDKDHIDVFLGPDAERADAPVFVVNQVDPKTGEFDEHKVMLGFSNETAARDAYAANYEPGWQGLGSIGRFDNVSGFKKWLAAGETKKPVTQAASWRSDLGAQDGLDENMRAAIGQRFESAERAWPVFDSDLREIVDSVGGRAIVAPLKGIARTAAKVVGDYAGDATKIKDIVRGTIELPSHGDAGAVLDQLRAKYGEPVKLKNSLDPDAPAPFANGYRDINSVWSVDGEPVELQINVPEMLAAKKKAHPLYKEAQKIRRTVAIEDRAPTQAERARLSELDARQAAIYDPAWAEAMRRMNSSREITSASSRNIEPETRLPDGQTRQSYSSSDASLPSGKTPKMALGPNSGSGEVVRGASTATIGATSGEILPQDRGGRPDGPQFTEQGEGNVESADANLAGTGQVDSGRPELGSNAAGDAGATAGGEPNGQGGRARGDVPRTDDGAAQAVESVARDSHPAGEGGQPVESLRDTLARSSIGTALGALERNGVLRLVDDPKLETAGRWDGARATLNAARIPAGAGVGVALHELGIHRERDAGVRGILGDAVFQGIVGRIKELEGSTAPALERARSVIAEARERVSKADVPEHLRDEELIAYTAEIAASRPTADGVVRDLLNRIVSRVRAWLATGPLGRAFAARGFALRVTPDDLAQIAVAAVRRQARTLERGPAPAAAEVRNSMPRVGLTAEQIDALGSIGVSPKLSSLRDRIREITDRAGEKLTQGIVDQFAPLKNLDETAYMQARLSRGTDGALEAAFLHGTPKLTDGALDVERDGKGLRGVLADLNGEHDLFLAWITGNRAEKLKAEGRERLFTDKQIAALKALNQGKMADGRDRSTAYAKAHVAFRLYQKSVLDIAEHAGLINPDSRTGWENEFYVPFYRVAEGDQEVTYGKASNGLVKQQAIKQLKGGKDPLGDLLANTLGNWSNLLTGSMRNMAASKSLVAAEKMGIARKLTAAEKGSVWIMDDGRQVHYAVDDPLVLDALTSLNYSGIQGKAMDVMRWFKHALTIGVTISPTFRVRNLIRDSLSVIAISDEAGYNPLRNIVQGWGATKEGTDTSVRMLAGGGKIRFGSLNDGAQARHARRLIEADVKDGQILDTPEKLKAALGKAWDWWNEVGDRSETINRSAVYERARATGKSHLEASYEARDLLDFTMGGKWTAVRFLTGVVPFLNARIQGLYRLGKGAHQNTAKFAAVAGAVAMASALTYLLQKDDDDYKALPDWARDSYWCIKLGDQMLYIPKPFEIGALGSVVERSTELAVSGGDYQARDLARTLASIMGDQLAMNPIPQAVKPALEAAFNYDTFRGNPIDSMGDERLPAEDRRGPTTSAGAVAVGRAVGMSPKRIEHLARGYFGWLGTQALNASDWMLRDAMSLPSNPRRDLTKVDNIMAIGDFVKSAQANSDKYVNRYYAVLKQIDQTYAAYSQARKTDEDDRAAELRESRDLKLRPLYESANKRISKINQRIKTVSNDRDLSAREKRVELDALYQQRAEIAKSVDERARQD